MNSNELLNGYYLLTLSDEELKNLESFNYSYLSFFLTEEEYKNILLEKCFLANPYTYQKNIIEIAASVSMSGYCKAKLIDGYTHLSPPKPPLSK